MRKKEVENSKRVFAWSLFEIGWRISVPLILFVLGGVWLDNKLHTKPLFILLGIVFSLVTTSIGIYKTIQNTFKEE